MSYVTSFEEVLYGISLVAITMVMHGCGMIATLLTCNALGGSRAGDRSFLRGASVLILASWMIVLIHLVEVLVWAAFLLWKGAMAGPSAAYYYALMQYTTVGSSATLPERWRLLDGLLPIAGLMTFAWSTGVLFTLAEAFQKVQLSAINERRARRLAARGAKGRGRAGE